ncbi:response regulator transcription factor [Vallitalea okinawensis]|uniref:response regulator transcription factor n=1 Tax=Vallitalea okinawensis TaxID=2078660 RepID=UPI000CFAD85C|nr:response regulator [Vallitalea okinawensis]
MYKLIVVDDELIIREGIVNTIPWGKWGFEVVGQGQNGIEAIELIEKYKPDVILTDIKMPTMDGIELMNIISEKYNDLEIVILSGYSEVEYYRKAIKCHVVDYLLKPTCYEDFEKVSMKIKARLDKKNQRIKENKELKKQLLESLPYMRQIFLKQICNGLYSDQLIIKEKMKFYDIHLVSERLAVIALSFDNYSILNINYSEEQNYLLKQSLMYLANQLVQEFGNGSFYIENQMIIGIYNFKTDDCFKQVIAFIEKLQSVVYELKSITLSAGVSEECSNIVQLKYFYNQAVEALKQRIYLGNESITCYKDIMDVEDMEYLEYRFNSDKIIDFIFYNGQDNIDVILDEVFNNLKNKLMKRYDYIDKLWYELYYAIARYAVRFNLDMDDIIHNRKNNITEISSIENLDLKRKWILDILSKCRQHVDQRRDNHQSKLIMEAKKYVDENYSDNGMSLSMVADKFNKNHAYLSKLFKKETGENFTDYIIKLRVNKSKELLKDITIKTYEVANQVGYADTSHFIKVFKKYTGMSTSQYRERHM